MSAMLLVMGTKIYSLPVFRVTIDLEWESIDFKPVIEILLSPKCIKIYGSFL
jgi:hypothetical protein